MICMVRIYVIHIGDTMHLKEENVDHEEGEWGA